jgi:peptidoglycan/LPS O-acetylase OafA/YrhL
MTAHSLRLDIEGLRAVAILLVLAFHAGLPLPGGFVGVDVFFVISGFLITGLLLREHQATGRVSLLDFYARRAKRLLPAATLVLVTTCLVTVLHAPLTDRAEFVVDLAGAAGYVANWRFAARAVDYLAEDVGRSPALHFWSLSVEEQFYFLWPVLLVIGSACARRFGWPVRRTFSVAILAVVGPSLAWSVWLTTHDQAAAFFVTGTRLWELGVGAILALLLHGAPQTSSRWGDGAAVLGVAAVGVGALAFGEGASWPGYAAALPTFGTALIVWGGARAPKGWVARGLGLGPLVWIGGCSYSIYLWHWPVLVLGQDWLGWSGKAAGIALCLASLVPAWLSYRFVEGPIRRSAFLAERPQLVLSFGGNLSLAVVALAFFSAHVSAPAGSTQAANVALEVQPGRVVVRPPGIGADALGTSPRNSKAGVPARSYDKIQPGPSLATKDLPRAYREGCQISASSRELTWCEAGDLTAERTVAMVGDSKILQYFEALDAVGQALGFRLRVATKSMCAFTDAVVGRGKGAYPECMALNVELMKVLAANPPLAVITSQVAATALPSLAAQERTSDAMVSGLESRWRKVRALGSEVIVILDNPHPRGGLRVYECLLEHPEDQSRCAFSRKKGREQSAAPVQLRAAERVPGVHVVDLTDYLCPSRRCAPVIGDVLVYRQGSHITNAYAKTLAPKLTQELAEILGQH